MLYCDLSIDGTIIWTGIPCVCGMWIKDRDYIPFVGDLVFADTQGYHNPTYDGLESRYLLLYVSPDGPPNYQVPLQALPFQSVGVILGGQNCTLTFYDKAADEVGPDFSIEVVPAIQQIRFDESGTQLNSPVTFVGVITRRNGYDKPITIHLPSAKYDGDDWVGTLDYLGLSVSFSGMENVSATVPDMFFINMTGPLTAWNLVGHDFGPIVGVGSDGQVAVSNPWQVTLQVVSGSFTIAVTPTLQSVSDSPLTFEVAITREAGFLEAINVICPAETVSNTWVGAINGKSLNHYDQPSNTYAQATGVPDSFEITMQGDPSDTGWNTYLNGVALVATATKGATAVSNVFGVTSEETISWDCPINKLDPDGTANFAVTVTGGSTYEWAIDDSHGGTITLGDPQGSNPMNVLYSHSDTTFTLTCLVDGATLLTQLVAIGTPVVSIDSYTPHSGTLGDHVVFNGTLLENVDTVAFYLPGPGPGTSWPVSIISATDTTVEVVLDNAEVASDTYYFELLSPDGNISGFEPPFDYTDSEPH